MPTPPASVRYDLPWDPTSGDVVCDRIPAWDGGPCGPLTAVERYQWPQELWYHRGIGFGWGYDGPAAQNYALAILDRFIAAGTDGPARHQGRWLACSALAVQMTPDFAAQVVARIPRWGGTVSGRLIRTWIAAEAPRWGAAGIDLVDLDGIDLVDLDGGWRRGDVVECIDDRDGANFLRLKRRYTVVHVQIDDAGLPRLCLAGMARAWECGRFRLVSGADARAER